MRVLLLRPPQRERQCRTTHWEVSKYILAELTDVKSECWKGKFIMIFPFFHQSGTLTAPSLDVPKTTWISAPGTCSTWGHHREHSAIIIKSLNFFMSEGWPCTKRRCAGRNFTPSFPTARIRTVTLVFRRTFLRTCLIQTMGRVNLPSKVLL